MEKKFKDILGTEKRYVVYWSLVKEITCLRWGIPSLPTGQ